MKKKNLHSILVLLVWFFASQIAQAQLVQPCPSNTQPPADTCGECIYCGFNGLMSSTAGYSPGTVPLFCGTIENNQWLGFVAGETGATFSAIPTSCANGDGIQIALMNSSCTSLVACNGGEAMGANLPVSMHVDTMVPGQTYYLMIDGFAGDQCAFTIAVSPNSAIQPSALTAPSSISGPTNACAGTTRQYCISQVYAAAAYVWNAPSGVLINGMPSPVTILDSAGFCAEITFPSTPVDSLISVYAANSCIPTGPAIEMQVKSFPVQTTASYSVNACFPFTLPWGDVIQAPGIFEHSYTSNSGCDSLISIEVLPEFLVDAIDGTINCVGSATLQVNTTASNPQYNWSAGALPSNSATPSVALPGVYYVTVTDGNTGCSFIDSTEVVPIVGAFDLEIDGESLSCSNNTAELSAQHSLNNPTYQWSTGETTATISTQIAGNYALTVTNQDNGCTMEASYVLSVDQTAPLISITPPRALSCLFDFSVINLNAPLGYSAVWTFNGVPFSMPANLQVAEPGEYSVTVTNPINGCSTMAIATVLLDTVVPVLSFGYTPVITCCSPTSVIPLETNSAANLSYNWSGIGGTFIVKRPAVSLIGNYAVTVTNNENGCSSIAAIDVLGDFSPPMIAATGGVLTCINQIVMLTASSASPVAFTWLGPGGYSSTETNPTILLPGTYLLQAKDLANCCVATTSAVVVDSCALATGDLINNSYVRVYPNATTGQLFVESQDVDFPIHAVTVQALDGKILVEKTNLNTNLQELDLGKYAKGMYVLWAEVGGKKLFFKVLLQ